MKFFSPIFEVAIFCRVERPIIIKDLCSGLQMDIKFWKLASVQLHSKCLDLTLFKVLQIRQLLGCIYFILLAGFDCVSPSI